MRENAFETSHALNLDLPRRPWLFYPHKFSPDYINRFSDNYTIFENWRKPLLAPYRSWKNTQPYPNRNLFFLCLIWSNKDKPTDWSNIESTTHEPCSKFTPELMLQLGFLIIIKWELSILSGSWCFIRRELKGLHNLIRPKKERYSIHIVSPIKAVLMQVKQKWYLTTFFLHI